MKTTALLIIFSIQTLIGIAQSKPYIPFPPQLIIYGYTKYCTGNGPVDTDYRLEIGGDTVVNNLHYSKYYLDETLEGAIRNALSEKKVFLYTFATQTEQLLYDFNLQVGDTVFSANGYGFPSSLLYQGRNVTIDTAWVTRIDSILMPHDNLYHKRFNLKAKIHYPSNHPLKKTPVANSDSTITLGDRMIKIEPLVEGVGPLYNPVSSYGDFEECLLFHYYCISINGKTVKPSDPFSHPHDPKLCEVVYTGIDETSLPDNVGIFPNPSTGKFQLLLQHPAQYAFEISNVLGKKILASMINKEQTEIDLSSQLPGIYFIHIFKPGKTGLTRKIVIH